MYLTEQEKTALTNFCGNLPSFSDVKGWRLNKVENGIHMYVKNYEYTGSDQLWPYTQNDANESFPKSTAHCVCCKTTITAPSDFIMSHLVDPSFLIEKDSRITSCLPLKTYISDHSHLQYWNMEKPHFDPEQDPRYALLTRIALKNINASMFNGDLNTIGYFIADHCPIDSIARGVRRNVVRSEQPEYEPSEDSKDLYTACIENSIQNSNVILFQSTESTYCDEKMAELHAMAQNELDAEAEKPHGDIIGREEQAKKEGKHIMLSQVLAPSNAIRAEVLPGSGFFIRPLLADEGMGSEVFYVLNVVLHEQDDNFSNYLTTEPILNIRKALNDEWKEQDQGVDAQVKRHVDIHNFLESPHIGNGVTPVPSRTAKFTPARPGYTYVPPKNAVERYSTHEEA